MSADGLLAALVTDAQQSLERALAGSSLCSVSRDQRHGASAAKYFEGRWYALRDIQRTWLAAGSAQVREDALDALDDRLATASDRGPAWQAYDDGARSAVTDARACLRPTT